MAYRLNKTGQQIDQALDRVSSASATATAANRTASLAMTNALSARQSASTASSNATQALNKANEAIIAARNADNTVVTLEADFLRFKLSGSLPIIMAQGVPSPNVREVSVSNYDNLVYNLSRKTVCALAGSVYYNNFPGFEGVKDQLTPYGWTLKPGTLIRVDGMMCIIHTDGNPYKFATLDIDPIY